MKNIFLIGFMGCGKSAVSSWMKEYHHMECVEMDEEIVLREGISIPMIFEKYGENYFRKLETQLLRELQSRENIIVSCGGGVVLKEENVELMKSSGTIVLLTAEPETILERVKDDENRPLLKGNKNISFIQEMLEKRRPMYEQAAEFQISTDGKAPGEICKEIIRKVKGE